MLFLGCLFDRSREDEYLNKSKSGLSNAANTFQWNLIDGLNANLEKPVSIVNVLPVGVFPVHYKEFVLKSRNWDYAGADCREVGAINAPVIKQLYRFIKCRALLKETSEREILVYSAYLPFLMAIRGLDQSYHVTAIITDLPEYYDLGKVSLMKRILRRINNYWVYKCLERIDSFVLLTEEMKYPLKIGSRPYVVIEGICGSSVASETPDTKKEGKTILYTGTLHKQFGIGDLLQAFSEIDDPEIKLWICGVGDMQHEVEKMTAQDPRITYFGYVSKSRVDELQRRASVLINPRPNSGAYTKYSFPSKTMEYMLSGTPVLMYKLDGIPDEYDPYYFRIPESADGMKNVLAKVMSIPEQELRCMGQKASEYMRYEKTPARQALKLLRLLGWKDTGV